MSGNPEYNDVLKAVSSWPPEQRLSLAHALIDGVADDARSHRPKPTLDQLVGIARGHGPAPSDDQVKRWIDEARIQKYGR